jgi:hypothetical protein
MPRDPFEILVRLIAAEKDPHQLINLVTSDDALLREARRAFDGQKRDGAVPRAVELCGLYRIPYEYFQDRLRLIVHLLDLVPPEEDYYRILGLDTAAGHDEIRRAFRRLSLLRHPDVNPGDPRAEERFRMLREAYEVLSDGALRERYDLHLAPNSPRLDDSSPVKPRKVWWSLRPQFRWLGILVVLLVVASLFVDYQGFITRRYYRAKYAQVPTLSKEIAPAQVPEMQKAPDAPAEPAAAPAVKPAMGSGAEPAKAPAVRSGAGPAGAPGSRPAPAPVPRTDSAAGPDNALLMAAPAAVPAVGPGDAVLLAAAGIPEKQPPPEPPMKPPVKVAPPNSSPPIQALARSSSPVPEPGSRPSSASAGDSKPSPVAAAASGSSPAVGAPSASPGSIGVAATSPSATAVASSPSPAAVAPPSSAPSDGGDRVGVKVILDRPASSTRPAVGGEASKPPPPKAEVLIASAKGDQAKGAPTSKAAAAASGPSKGVQSESDAKLAKAAAPEPPKKPVNAPDMKQRLQDFLNRYASAFENRNSAAFLSLFEPDAVENGAPVSALAAQYRKNFQQLEDIRYTIQLAGWEETENRVKVKGNFRLHLQVRGESARTATGTMQLELMSRGDGFRVKKLAYIYQ